MRNADIAINNDGVSTLVGKTKAGIGWLNRHVSPADLGYLPERGIPAESSYAEDIAIGALRDGLQVDVNGEPVKVGEDDRVVFDRKEEGV